MIDHALVAPRGELVVPGNRWDLAEHPAAQPLEVSVVVPYYQGAEQLALLLEGLRGQDFPSRRFEVLVADDGSPDPLDLGRFDTSGLRVRAFHQENKGFRAAAARNLAAASAEGQVLCFLDQDTIPEPSYLSAISRLPGQLPDALVVGRREHADLAGWNAEGVRDWFSGKGPAPEILTAPEWLSREYRDTRDLLDAGENGYKYIISAVMACSTALFRELGGFDESFQQYGGEDWEFAHRAWNAGAVLAHEPRAVAWHDGPDWAGRSTPESRQAMKQDEKEALLRRIPESEVCARPDHPANLLLTWTGLTDVHNQAVQDVLDHLRAAPLNIAVQQNAQFGPQEQSRARFQATLHGMPEDPEQLTASIEDALTWLRHSGAGEVRLDEPRLTITATRARRRAERWQNSFPGRDLLDDLFGRVELASQVRTRTA
ncbi:hypothetical protein Kisp01_28760 [Kineosporia sp. NBRC 101677]|uniref:glycosyltransferase family 2 protein n=1 Tax=Kineosporia sp. NBRC 101677 TaxID=3032197 RepID=UPI0024A2A52E|nr:glycosyltransferase [Kineosporia sp. NBRC 101677]GLY15861.1 hypothetical protein Kisp01_28760 [Kineosporia sp. NBRC 101677]